MTRDDAFSAFVRARHVHLLLIARAICFDPQTAEDVLQEALADVYGRWKRVSAGENVEAYVVRVMYSKHASLRRRFTRRWAENEVSLELVNDMSDGVGTQRTEQAIALVQAIRALTPAQRSIVGLRYYAGLSLQEISSALDMPIGTVGSHLSRAHNRLATLLSSEEGGLR